MPLTRSEARPLPDVAIVPSAIPIPSTPLPTLGVHVTVGGGAADTMIVSGFVAVVLRLPSPSCAVALTPIANVPAAAGLIASPFSTPAAIWLAEKMMLPLVTVSVSPLLLLRIAVLGTAVRVIEKRLLLSPVRPFSVMPKLSGIA